MFQAMLIFMRTILLVQHLVSSFSLGDSSDHRWSELSPKESDDTTCCTKTTVLLKMNTIVLKTCRGVK